MGCSEFLLCFFLLLGGFFLYVFITLGARSNFAESAVLVSTSTRYLVSSPVSNVPRRRRYGHDGGTVIFYHLVGVVVDTQTGRCGYE